MSTASEGQGGETRTEGEGPSAALLEEVERLKRAGEHVRAAERLVEAGFTREAGAIFEQLFEDARALAAYEAGGDLEGAMRVALRLGDNAAVDRVIAEATQTGAVDPLFRMLDAAGRHVEIGKIHLARADFEQAAEAFTRGQRFDRAAACREAMGDLRGAGVLYERHLEVSPGDPDACLKLGRILARFSRHDDAITLLQRAVRNAPNPDKMMRRAAPTLILSFTSLGYEEAAQAVLERWQRSAAREGESAPSSLEEFLSSDRAMAFAAVLSKEATTKRRPLDEAPSGAGLDAFFGAGAEPEDKERPAPPGDESAGGLLLAGRYLLGEPLGGGGVGQVFRAYDAFSDRPVAVKIFGAQAMLSDAVKAYAREARAASSLEHPAIAPLVELNMPQGFVVTALIDGVSVEQRLQEGGDAGWLMPFARALLDVLGATHRVGLVHGALKPTNVFLVPGGVRMVDFGAHHLLALRSTETGGLASVWPYLAPEQLFGAPADARADLYALAAMLYRALTGRPPFARAEDDRRSAPRPVSELVPALGPAWDAFFAKALAPRAADRFQSAREMAEALPRLPEGYSLPKAASLAGESPAPVILEETHRYSKGALVFRDGARARVYEGQDLTVSRPVWILELDDDEGVAALAACARIARGVQPVYDVLPDARRAVIARDPEQRRADLAALRQVPQSLVRDLSAVASALESLHASGLALGGFEIDRAIGPVGPRLRLAPAPLPVARTDEGERRDWESFAALVDGAFDIRPDRAPTPRERLLAALVDLRALDGAGAIALFEEGAGEGWSAFLDRVTARLVAGAPGRIMARLAARLLSGEA